MRIWGPPWLGPSLGLVARLVLGVVLLIAGAIKLPEPSSSVRAVRAYDLLPEAIVPTIGYALPALEVVVGLLLIAGLLVRPAAVVSAVLMVAFVIGIASAWARGLQIECGCFGGGGYDAQASDKYPWEIARDLGLALLALWLVIRPRTYFAADNWLTPRKGLENVEEG